jgi:hypothetical protein
MVGFIQVQKLMFGQRGLSSMYCCVVDYHLTRIKCQFSFDVLRVSGSRETVYAV